MSIGNIINTQIWIAYLLTCWRLMRKITDIGAMSNWKSYSYWIGLFEKIAKNNIEDSRKENLKGYSHTLET